MQPEASKPPYIHGIDRQTKSLAMHYRGCVLAACSSSIPTGHVPNVELDGKLTPGEFQPAPQPIGNMQVGSRIIFPARHSRLQSLSVLSTAGWQRYPVEHSILQLEAVPLCILPVSGHVPQSPNFGVINPVHGSTAGRLKFYYQ